MKKSETRYYEQIDDYTTLNITVSEEVKDHLLVKFYDDRWRSKKEHIDLLKKIINKLEELETT